MRTIRDLLAGLKGEYKATKDLTGKSDPEMFAWLIRSLRLAGIIRLEFENYSSVFFIETSDGNRWHAELKAALRSLCEQTLTGSQQ
jgi:hypothetical protein